MPPFFVSLIRLQRAQRFFHEFRLRQSTAMDFHIVVASLEHLGSGIRLAETIQRQAFTG